MDKKHGTERRTQTKVLAVFCLLAVSGFAVPPGWSGEEGSASASRTVVVVPFTVSGRVDETLTSTFTDELSSKQSGLRIVEGSLVAKRLPKGKIFNSAREIDMLVKAAKAAGVDAVIVGRASRYTRMDAPGVKLKVSLVDVSSGETLHEELSKETAWSSKGAKKEVAQSATKSLVKSLKGK
jgi:hypothetical protein